MPSCFTSHQKQLIVQAQLREWVIKLLQQLAKGEVEGKGNKGKGNKGKKGKGEHGKGKGQGEGKVSG